MSQHEAMSRVLVGDCREVMATMGAASVDAVVTDPPYDLTANKKGGSGAASVNLDSPYGRARIGTGNGGGFMGKDWDATGVAFDPATWEAVARVMKPGAHLLAFGGTRTFHRMTVAIEDAGFEIRDCLSWLYGSGFPKSLNVGDGRGTALKPAWEPIIMARKPLIGTVAANVATHGCGALNIDACRIEYQSAADQASAIPQGKATAKSGAFAGGTQNDNARSEFAPSNDKGRWPANVCLDETAAALLDAMSGRTVSKSGGRRGTNVLGMMNDDGWRPTDGPRGGYDDTGGASRFFYCAKASRSERNAGLDGMPEHERRSYEGGAIVSADHPETSPGGHTRPAANNHPTVKPLALMRWLVRLVTPPGGLVLDPFAGSGSTGVACAHEGFRFLGIEQSDEYAEIARRRIAAVNPLFAMAAD